MIILFNLVLTLKSALRKDLDLTLLWPSIDDLDTCLRIDSTGIYEIKSFNIPDAK